MAKKARQASTKGEAAQLIAEAVPVLAVALKPAIDEAIELSDVFKCLVEGPARPEAIDPPPERFGVRAWQDQKTGKLQLRVDSLEAAEWTVEVAFEDPDPKDTKAAKDAKVAKDTKDTKDLQDLTDRKGKKAKKGKKAPEDEKGAENEKAAEGKKVEEEDLKAGAEFDLPKRWKESPGARFVTVYLRKKEKASAEEGPKKREEAKSTIIRIVPAPVRQDTADEFGELERPAGTDE